MSNRALQLLDEYLSAKGQLDLAQAEHQFLPILREAFRLQGFHVVDQVRPDVRATDFLADPIPGGPQTERLGIEYKQYLRNVDARVIDEMISKGQRMAIGRIVVVANSGFTDSARQSARTSYPVAIQLYDLNEFRSMIATLADGRPAPQSRVLTLIRLMSEQFARVVASDPIELDNLEWRDLERMMATVFEGIGFEAELTAASKDGGKDVILRFMDVDGTHRSFIVELKHWRSGKAVGGAAVKNFVEVVANELRDGGLFLSTYGFSPHAFSSLTEVQQAKIGYGSRERIVDLCRTYVRACDGLWAPADANELSKLLFN